MTREKKLIIGLITALVLAIGVIVGLLVSGVFAGDTEADVTSRKPKTDNIDSDWIEVEVLSASMSAENALPEHKADAIESGDTVYLDPVSADEICIGDVIGFYEGDIIVVHKVYSITEANSSLSGQREFVTFGINNWGTTTDPTSGKVVKVHAIDAEPVLAENLIGRVVHREPSSKSLLK